MGSLKQLNGLVGNGGLWWGLLVKREELSEHQNSVMTVTIGWLECPTKPHRSPPGVNINHYAQTCPSIA